MLESFSSMPALDINSTVNLLVSQNDSKDIEINRLFVFISNLEYGVSRFLRNLGQYLPK
jgi:hypothetical protein